MSEVRKSTMGERRVITNFEALLADFSTVGNFTHGAASESPHIEPRPTLNPCSNAPLN